MRVASGASRLTGLLGWPVSHSKSPRLHGAWLAAAGIDAVYIPLKVAPADLAQVLTALPRMGFIGLNVTVPHKQAVIPLLDRLDPLAEAIGAVNSIVIDDAGRLSGSNTDAAGFLLNLRESQPDFRASQGPIALLGAGGAARAVVASLLEDGADEIRVINRSLGKARDLADHFGAKVRPIAWSGAAEALDGVRLLVNSTSLGMQGQPPLTLALDALPGTALVNDLVYAPLETDLLRQARQRGNPVADGLGMLIHQARPAFAAWFGVWPTVTAEIRAMMAAP